MNPNDPRGGQLPSSLNPNAKSFKAGQDSGVSPSFDVAAAVPNNFTGMPVMPNQNYMGGGYDAAASAFNPVPSGAPRQYGGGMGQYNAYQPPSPASYGGPPVAGGGQMRPPRRGLGSMNHPMGGVGGYNGGMHPGNMAMPMMDRKPPAHFSNNGNFSYRSSMPPPPPQMQYTPMGTPQPPPIPQPRYQMPPPQQPPLPAMTPGGEPMRNPLRDALPPSAVPAAPSYLKEPPKIIMVAGYRKTGKTTTAKELAKAQRFEYISLRPETPEEAEFDEEAEEDEAMEEHQPLQALFTPLVQLLERKQGIKGIVIDDALQHNKFEPHYVNFLLNKFGMHVNVLVIITSELSDLVKRNVSFKSPAQMQIHPESFEFGQSVEDFNTLPGGTPIAVVEGTVSLEAVVRDAVEQVGELMKRKSPPLALPEVELMPHCPMVCDPFLVNEIIDAETAALQLANRSYGFPYTEPNYLLDYVQFVKNALLFQNYLLVPWIWGDKVSIIGYGDAVYIHLPSYQVVFKMQEVPPALGEMIAELKAAKSSSANTTAAAGAAAGDKKSILFSVEAAMQDNVLFISDMMLLGDQRGAEMILQDRVALLKKYLGKLPAGGPLQLLQTYPVNQLAELLSDYKGIARGALFVNPDGMQAGNYESRNFIYASEEKKTVQIRIWNGRLESNNMWTFDAYARDSEKNVIITSDGATPVHVIISDDDVMANCLNDGNVIECIRRQDSAPQHQPRGKKNGKATNAYYFAFLRRCNWQVTPTTLYYQSAFVAPPQWSTSSFLDACSTIKYVEPPKAS